MDSEIENAYLSLLNLPYKQWVVGYSGGVDSTVLLDLVRQVLSVRKELEVIVVHVNHSVNIKAEEWANFCEQQAKKVDLRCVIERISPYYGKDLENYWREKRYQCLRNYLVEDGCLLTAHHALDQAESFFLHLLRGCGLRGLEGMQFRVMPYYHGFLFRPLLKVSKEEILSYARKNSLIWIEDDSNQNLYYQRNFLRFLLPFFSIKWPTWLSAIRKTTENLQKNSRLFEEYLADDLENHLKDNCFCYGGLSLLKIETLLSYWFYRDFNVIINRSQRAAILEMVNANAMNNPSIKIGNLCIFRYKNCLYVDSLEIFGGKIFINKNLKKEDFYVTYYQGGEKIKLLRRGHTHRLKKLFQEWQVPFFRRRKVPLLFYRDQLVAVIGFENNGIVHHYEVIKTTKTWEIVIGD